MRGEWRSEATWPPERLTEQVLRPEGAGTDTIHVRGDVGHAAWISCAGKLPWGLPDDQRADDALSLAYDWEPLAADLDVMGHPRVRLTVTSPVPVAYVSAKLCDVFPDGTSALAGRGLLNLTHRDGHDAPVALEPGVPTEVEIELEATSWIFEPGHRVRLSLAGADWPNIWPPPSGAPLAGRSRERRARAAGARRPAVAARAGAAADDRQGHARAGLGRRAAADGLEARGRPASGTSPAASRDPARTTRRRSGRGSRSATRAPSASRRTTRRSPGRAGAPPTAITWPEADVRTEATLDVRSDAEAYHVVITLVAEELGARARRDGVLPRAAVRAHVPRRLA